MPTPEHSRRRQQLAVGLAAIAVMLSLCIAGVALIQRFDATTTARHNNQRVWHTVICEIEHAVYHTPQLSARKRAFAIKFYNNLLVRDVGTLPCTKAEILGHSRALSH